MRCPRCGNENPDGNRFCGMCGATLLSAPAIAETATQRAASAGTAAPSSVPVSVVPSLDPPRPPAREPHESPESRETTHEARRETAREPIRETSDDGPIISGPSFLGLSDPNPRKRATLRADGHSSRNVDYLLEDEPPEEGGGAGKFILIVAVLALAAGFGYMTWRNHGVGWVSTMLSKPPAPAQAPSDGANSAPSATPANPAPESQIPQPSPSTSPATNTQPPASDNPKPSNPAAATPATTSPATPQAEDSKTATAANPPADSDEGEDAPAKGASTEEKTPAAPAAKPAKPRAAIETPPKPRAAVEAAKPVDTVSEAQKYLYGRGGEAQDCDRGLRLLKPAANAGNAKAMIEMGALYSAGLCTPRDLPTAYRWFAIALRKDPENDSVQHDLQKIWSEMTQPERQLAIKLSQ